MMAAKLMQPPPVTGVVRDTPNVGKLVMVMSADGAYSGRVHLRKKSSIIRFGYYSSGFKPIRVSEQRSELGVADEAKTEVSHPRTPTQIKEDLHNALQGINRGIFGVTSEKKSEIDGLVNLLESMNPFPEPTLSMDKVAGCWKVVYSTIKILGRKRTKLGMRGFVSLGDIIQTVNVPEEKSVDMFMFNMKGMDFLNGHLKIESSFKIASESRVDLKYEKSTVTPDQLLTVFRKKLDTLLSIFNPEGWHEITYLDETLRIGRDDKGNVFILERYHVPES